MLKGATCTLSLSTPSRAPADNTTDGRRLWWVTWATFTGWWEATFDIDEHTFTLWVLYDASGMPTSMFSRIQGWTMGQETYTIMFFSSFISSWLMGVPLSKPACLLNRRRRNSKKELLYNNLRHGR